MLEYMRPQLNTHNAKCIGPPKPLGRTYGNRIKVAEIFLGIKELSVIDSKHETFRATI